MNVGPDCRSLLSHLFHPVPVPFAKDTRNLKLHYDIMYTKFFALHRWSLEVEYKLSRLEKWAGSAEAFFTDENLGILKALSSNGRLKPEIDRLSLTELNRLELRAANEQFKSARHEKKISESQPDRPKENGRIAVGMRAYRRLTGGQ